MFITVNVILTVINPEVMPSFYQYSPHNIACTVIDIYKCTLIIGTKLHMQKSLCSSSDSLLSPHPSL